jgi:hypothetical protein
MRTDAPRGASDRVIASVFLTLRARPENLKGGALREEFPFAANVFLHPLELFVDEFNDVAALKADQVMVLGAAQDLFVAGSIFGKPVLRHESGILQEVKGVVHSRLGDLHPARNEAVVEILCIEMPLGFQDGVQHRKSLRGSPQFSPSLEVLAQNFVRCFRIHVLSCLELV